MEKIAKAIRDVPDFPKPGIVFKDITTLLADKEAFALTIDALCDHCKDLDVDAVLGIESRGFIFASVLAYKLGVGMIVVRKPGKLPWKSVREEYQLEYGTDSLEIHEDAIEKGARVLIVDDLLATGGTVSAVANLVRRVGGEPVECAFVVELDFLKGRDRIPDVPVFSLVHY